MLGVLKLFTQNRQDLRFQDLNDVGGRTFYLVLVTRYFLLVTRYFLLVTRHF